MLATATAAILLASGALAHMQMIKPPAMGSKFGPGPQSADANDMVDPLKPGLAYPCKGHHLNGALAGVVDTWPAGSAQTFTIAGGAVHGGGSCQLSLSYDNGATWNVIHSIIGGCLVDQLVDIPFTLPAEAPNGKALFAWGWFNNLGNREMYHNCAVIDITNGGSGFSNSRDFPSPFVANSGLSNEVNSCSTEPSKDVVFPEPGKSVRYGGGYTGQTPAPGLNVVGTNCVGPGGVGNPGSGAPPPLPHGPPTSSSAVAVPPPVTSSPITVPPPVLAVPNPPVGEPSSTTLAPAPTGTPVVGTNPPAGKVCRRWRSGRPAGPALKRSIKSAAEAKIVSRSRSTPRAEEAGAHAHAHKRARGWHGKGMAGRSF